MIKAVTFDFWNTIATVPPGAMDAARRRAIAAACESSDVQVEAELLARALEEVGVSWERSWAAGRHLHPREAAETLVRSLGVEGAAREMVAEAFLGAGREVELEFAPGIRSCLEELEGRGVRLGIVCDVGFSGGELLRELLAGEGLLGHFSGWGFSDEVGHYKPAPQIFSRARSPGRAAGGGGARRRPAPHRRSRRRLAGHEDRPLPGHERRSRPRSEPRPGSRSGTRDRQSH